MCFLHCVTTNCVKDNNIIHFIDRQRNDEKRRFAQEENLRLEVEKERKRKATAVKVMIMSFTSNQYSFHSNLCLFRNFSLMNQAKN